MRAMSTYEVLLFGHLLVVVAWVGTDVALQVLSFRTLRAGPERMVQFTADVEWIGLRLLIPSSLLVILFGILLTTTSASTSRDTWIVLASPVRRLVRRRSRLPRSRDRADSKLAAERGVDAPEVQARIRRVLSSPASSSCILMP